MWDRVFLFLLAQVKSTFFLLQMVIMYINSQAVVNVLDLCKNIKDESFTPYYRPLSYPNILLSTNITSKYSTSQKFGHIFPR